MKAIVYEKYGPPEVLKLKHVPKPIPKDNEVLIKVYAATVTAGDCEMRRFDLPKWIWLPIRLYMGLISPRIKILGQELAGEIEAVGKEVKVYEEGDQIYAPTDMKFGAYAEYLCLKSTHPMALKPINMTFGEAATVPTGGLNALHFLRKGNVQSGEKVLIIGAGGSIGTYAVQIAKSLGAEVTCIDSAKKLDMLVSIGADHVIDYTVEDFTDRGEVYDVIIDLVGTTSFSGILNSLRKGGRYVMGNPKFPGMLRGLWNSILNSSSSRADGVKVIIALTGYKTEDLIYLKNLIEKGKLISVIDKSFALEEMVKAHHYVESGDKAGNVVIDVNEIS